MVPRGQQPGRGRFQFLLQEPCILVWKCVSPTVAHRGALEVPAKVAVLWGPMCWTGVTTASVGWQLIRRKSRFLSQGPYALGWIHVCTRLQLTEAPGGHLLGGQAWGSRVLVWHNCGVWRSTLGRGKSHLFLKKSCTLGSGLQRSTGVRLRQQDFGWYGCRVQGSVQGHSG